MLIFTLVHVHVDLSVHLSVYIPSNALSLSLLIPITVKSIYNSTFGIHCYVITQTGHANDFGSDLTFFSYDESAGVQKWPICGPTCSGSGSGSGQWSASADTPEC